MNAIKQLAVFAVLASVGVGLYFKLQSDPDPIPPADFAGSWGTPPEINLPQFQGREPTGPPSLGESRDSSPGDASESAAMASTPPPWEGIAAPPDAAPPVASHHTSHSAGDVPLPSTVDDSPSSMPPAGSGPVADATSAGPPSAENDPLNTATTSRYSETQTTTFDAARQVAMATLDQGRMAEGLLLLSQWYGEPSLDEAKRRDLESLLGQLAGTVIYSTEHHVEPAHVVQPGETLMSIASQYDVSWQLLAKINGLSGPEALPPGTELKVIRGPFSAVVDLDARRLTLMLRGYYAGRFAIGLGTERSNMEGDWIVQHKESNPTYHGGDRTIAKDDPENPLGEHWIGLASADKQAVVEPFGIHGTHDPESLHETDPRGYIRLAPRDAEDVYDILTVGSRVIVRR